MLMAELLLEAAEKPLMENRGGENAEAAVRARRRTRRQVHLALLFAYVISGTAFYMATEGWGFLQCTIFILSIVTGVGYGHLIPISTVAMVFTPLYISLGMVVFASVAGQLLDYLMRAEITAATDFHNFVQSQGLGLHESLGRDYTEKRQAGKRTQFIVGFVNVLILYCSAVWLFVGAFKQTPVSGAYFAAVSVLKLDSLCLLQEVVCSSGWQSSQGGKPLDHVCAIAWYVVTYGVVGHFLVSASNYLGTDPESTITTINKLTKQRFERMDKDGDGTITRAEFLRDRLIELGVERETIDAVLANFDILDKDRSGVINTADVGTLT